MRSPPLVPAFDFETCIVFDDFGRFRVYRETDENEVDRETVIRNIINGQYEKPVRVVAFNTAEGWSRDITEDIGREIVERAVRAAGRGYNRTPWLPLNTVSSQTEPERLIDPAADVTDRDASL
jgi:hypothetical protein